MSRQNTRYNGAGAMSENNENLLAVAWWVILNSPELLEVFIHLKLTN